MEIRKSDNIYDPEYNFGYYIIPSRLKYDNATISMGSGWVHRAHIQLIVGGKAKDISNVYGFVATGNGGSGTRDTSISGTLKITFANAAQNLTTGQYYNVVVEFYNAKVRSISKHDRFACIACFTSTSFDINAYPQTISSDQIDSEGNVTSDGGRLIGVQTYVKIYVVNSSGTTVSGSTFAYPFRDIDVQLDASSEGRTVVGGEYAESVTVRSGCSYTYIPSGEHGTPGSWLNHKTNETVSLPCRFYNEGPTIDDASHTSIVCIMNSDGGVVSWTGTDCGTNMNGEALNVYTITYNLEGGSGSFPVQYVRKDRTVKLNTGSPTKSIRLTYNTNTGTETYSPTALMYPSSKYTKDTSVTTRNNVYYRNISLSFLGWGLTNKDHGTSSDVEYSSGATTDPITSNTTLYAIWKATTLGTLPTYKSSGDDRIYRNDDATSDTPEGYGCQPQDFRLDRSAKWTSTKNDSSTGVTASTQIWKNTQIYALWEYKVMRYSDELAYSATSNRGYFELTANESSFANYSSFGDNESLYPEAKVLFDTTKTVTVDGTVLDSYSKANPDLCWKRYGVDFTIYRNASRSGYNFVGWDTSKTTDAGAAGYNPVFRNVSSVKYTQNRPIVLYLRWAAKKYSVTFTLGYNGDPTLKVVGNISYGGSVSESAVPQVGQTYNGIVFERKGPFVFMGWSGSYTNVRCDTTCSAIWEFSPIWQMVKSGNSQKWVPYKPKEKEV